jgi:hypothetical protein
MKSDPYISPVTEINSKWIEDLNVRLYETTRRVASYHVGEMLQDIVWARIYFRGDPKSTENKSKNK